MTHNLNDTPAANSEFLHQQQPRGCEVKLTPTSGKELDGKPEASDEAQGGTNAMLVSGAAASSGGSAARDEPSARPGEESSLARTGAKNDTMPAEDDLPPD